MAGEFRKLPIKRFPKPESRKDTQEQKFWKAFQFPTTIKEYSAINYIDFSPVAPYDCLVTCSGKMQIFAPYTNNVKRTSNRNKENVYGGRFRLDGKLMVAGGDSGLVQVLDVNSRSILRNLKGHTKATHVCSFGQEFTKIYSASDDKTLRCWDLPTEKETLMIKAHKDYVRCGCINITNTDQFITGSYDHTVKIWDCRSSSVAMEMNHGAPVECVLMHRNGGMCLSAGSNYIKVWDVLGGGRLYHQFSNHQKTITTMCFDGENKRLLSAGLDRHVKVYDVKDFSNIATLDYPSPILAIGLSADSNHLVAGMTDGAISIRNRPKPTTEAETQKRVREPMPGTYQYRMRNQTTAPGKNDVIVKLDQSQKHSKADRYLRKFQYHDALDAVLGSNGANATYVISLLTELSRRDALEIALSNRDADSLKEIMHFLFQNISNPMYGKILIPVADLILDMYSGLIGQNAKFDYMLEKLRNRISVDLRTQEEMMKLLGAMEQIFSMSTPAPNMLDDSDEDGEGGTVDNEVDFVVSDSGGSQTEQILIN